MKNWKNYLFWKIRTVGMELISSYMVGMRVNWTYYIVVSSISDQGSSEVELDIHSVEKLYKLLLTVDNLQMINTLSRATAKMMNVLEAHISEHLPNSILKVFPLDFYVPSTVF